MPAASSSSSQPYILLHMPIWSRPALWNVKKYVSLGWDPRAGTPSLPAALMASAERCVPGAGKKEPDQLQLDLVPFNQLQWGTQ